MINSSGSVKVVRLRSKNVSWSVLLVIAVFSTSVAITLGARYGFSVLTPPRWYLLPITAVLAEFMPVSIRRRDMNMTFTLPLVFGVSVAMGPMAALGTDLLATLVGAIAAAFSNHGRFSAYWTFANLIVAGAALPMAYLGQESVKPTVSVMPGSIYLGALVFLVVYAATNLGLVSILSSVSQRGGRAESIASPVGIGARSFALYAVILMAVAAVIRAKFLLAVPLTLVPVWAFRTAQSYHERMTDYYLQTISALTDMLERTHPYTQGHVERVAWTAEEVGRRLGLPYRRARLLKEAAILHDIGKIAVDESILDKPSRLTLAEMDHVRTHAVSGAKILAPVPELKPIVAWVQHHHERPDGTGYPDGLMGDQIPMESRVIAVIDAFDAMTGGDAPGQTRPYRKTISVTEAIMELERCAGTQFDPKVVQCFKRVVEEGGLDR